MASSAFERRTARRKFAVLGVPGRAAEGRPAEAASRALRARERAILPEIRRRGRTGAVLDRRIARGADGFARFAKEAQRRAAKGGSLPAAMDDTLSFTHRGREITEDDMDSDPEAPDDSDAEPANQDGAPRSHAQVMADVVATAKAHRAERQRASAETRALTEDADADFRAILGALPVRSKTDALRAEASDYDADVAALAFERRAAPSDRTPTPGDAARERAERTAAYARDVLAGMAADAEDAAGADAELPRDAAESHAAVRAAVDRDLRALCDAASAADAQAAYAALAKVSATASVAHVAHAVRARLAAALAGFARRRHMPPRAVLLLLHFALRVFRSSDRHHVVCTPASLAIAGFLRRGRLLSLEHVRSALFLVRLALAHALPGARFAPDALSALHFLLVLTTRAAPLASSPYAAARPVARAVHDAFAACGAERPAELSVDSLFGADASPRSLAAFARLLGRAALEQYAASPAAREVCGPIAALLGAAPPAASPRPAPLMMAARAPQIASLEPEVVSARAARAADRGAHLRRERGREMRGARRELRRDAAFVAARQRTDTLDADRKYAERQRRILGTIAGDASN